MIPTFDLLRRTLAATTLVALTSVAAAAAPASNDSASDGHFKQCHGYIRHVSDVNIKVHCIDGIPSDQSFLYFPRYAHAARRQEHRGQGAARRIRRCTCSILSRWE